MIEHLKFVDPPTGVILEGFLYTAYIMCLDGGLPEGSSKPFFYQNTSRFPTKPRKTIQPYEPRSKNLAGYFP